MSTSVKHENEAEKRHTPQVIWCWQLSWKRKLATVKSYEADVSNVSPSSER